MALFENFPYTNLHELNLDWLIDQLNIIKDQAVLSVNGMTGDVILYESANVILPEIQNGTWTFFRTANGVERGIQFGSTGKAYIMNASDLYELYASNNPPPYPVTSVNGQTGDITLYTDQYVRLPDLDDAQMSNWNLFRHLNSVTSGIQFEDDGKAYIMLGANRYEIYTSLNPSPSDVTSVNGQTGAVVLYQNNVVQLPDIDDNTVTYWNIYRMVNNGAYGIQFNTDGTIDLIQPNATRYKIYSANDQPPYPVTSVNNQTGDITLSIPDQLVDDADDDYLQITADASAYSWGIMRTTDGGNIGIKFDFTANTPTAHLRYYDSNDDEYKTFQLLSINDIPSSSVVSVNGQAGVVVLTGEDIHRSTSNTTDLDTMFTEIETEMDFVINGDTCSSNVDEGQFVMLRESTIIGANDGIYTAVNAKAANATWAAADLASVSGGALNALLARTKKINITSGLTVNSHAYIDAGSVDVIGDLVVCQLRIKTNNNSSSDILEAGDIVVTSGMPIPADQSQNHVSMYGSLASIEAWVTSDGKLQLTNQSQTIARNTACAFSGCYIKA